MSSLLMSILMLAPPMAEAPKEDAPPYVLPTEQRYASHLDAIRAFVARKDWAVATTLVQKLLDLDEDVFVTIREREKSFIVSLRGEANRLLLDMPAEGREFYQQEYGPKAVDLLTQGRMFKDERMLVQTVRRYLHTEAGLEASERLGIFLTNRGHNSAAVHFKHVLERIPPEKLTTETLQKAAIAFRRAGNGPRFELVWRALAAKPEVRLDEARKEIEKQAATPLRSRKDWPTFRGDPSRNASATGGMPILEPLWTVDLIEHQYTRDLLKNSVDALRGKNQPVLPAQQPLSLALSRDTGVFGLTMARTFRGQQARTLQKDDQEGLKAGEIFWEDASPFSLEQMVRDPHSIAFLSAQLRSLRPGVLFENTTFGSASTDGRHHFIVEDLQVPGPGNQPRDEKPRYRGLLEEALQGNRLQGTDIESGKIVWDAGEPSGDKRLVHSFFLSAPLILEGKLHVLNEKDGKIRLLTLKPETGALLSLQTLVTVRDHRPMSLNRQLDAAHLAYSEGVLVCPTNAGVVLGIELASGRTLWAFGYDTRSPKEPEKAERWRYPAPMIHRGRIIIAPPDSPAIYCVDLHDGSLAWKQSAQEGDQYVGGIIADRVLIVGARSCRAIDLTNGRTAWKQAIGTPSGLGIASGNNYLLPLAREVLSGQPEICVLNVARGLVSAHARSRNKDQVPGNLAILDGYLLSQTATSLTLNPLRESEDRVVAGLFKKNPTDPEAFIRRAQMKQSEGKMPDAIEDYRAALASGASKEQRQRMQDGLNEALLDFFRCDLDLLDPLRDQLARLHPYLAHPSEIYVLRALSKKQEGDLRGAIEDYRLAIAARPSRELRRTIAEHLNKALREESRREFAALVPYQDLFNHLASDTGKLDARILFAHFLARAGHLQEAKGNPLDAADFYLQIADLDNLGTMTPAEEPELRVSPIAWVRGRLDALLRSASPEQRTVLEKTLQARYASARSVPDVSPLRDFVALVGPVSQAGREARLELAERLSPGLYLVETEQLLLDVRRQTIDPKAAGRALEKLALVTIRNGFGDDGAAWFHELARDFSNIVVRDGKTGKELFNQALADKRYIGFLTPDLLLRKPLKATEGEVRRGDTILKAELDSPAIPYFQRQRLEIDEQKIRLIDQGSGKETCSWTPRPPVGTMITDLLRAANGDPLVVRYQTSGHLLILTLGHRLFVLNPLVTSGVPFETTDWTRSLWGGGPPEPRYLSWAFNPVDGSARLGYDGWTTRLHGSGPIDSTVAEVRFRYRGWTQRFPRGGLVAAGVIIQNGCQQLIGAELLTGRVLWSRPPVEDDEELFHDGEHLFILKEEGEREPASARVLNMRDGTTVEKGVMLPRLKDRLIRTHGGTLLLVERAALGRLNLRQYDLLARKDRWQRPFLPGSMLLQTEEPFAGVVQPDGSVVIFDLETGKETMKSTIKPEHLKAVASIYLFRDAAGYYLAGRRPRGKDIESVTPNTAPGTGLRGTVINGWFYCFNSDGRLRWSREIEDQTLVTSQFQRMPIVLLSARLQKRAVVGKPIEDMVQTLIIDKESGKTLFERSEKGAKSPWFQAINADERTSSVEVIRDGPRLIIKPEK
jgi:outer membrane protein assembly factor BamB/tetratricopeptide (TPR) repeat protein